MNSLSIVAKFKENFLAELDEFYRCYNGSQPHAISALGDKLHWMAFHIGSPSSIEPMLKSIASGKIKYWGSGDTGGRFNTRGIQLKGMHIGEMTRRFDDVLKGHFRWNFGSYTLTRETRDYIHNFWFNDNFKAQPSGTRIKDIIAGSSGVKYPKSSPIATILYLNTPNYRWQYTKYQNGREVFTTNIGNGDVTGEEMCQMRQMLRDYKKQGALN